MREKLLWVDLETTGLFPEKGYPLEIAVALTNEDLEMVSFQTFVVNWAKTQEEVTASMPPRVRDMHRENGLMKEVFSGEHKSVEEIDQLLALDVVGWDRTVDRWEPCRLAGSKPSFDRKWIERWFPHFARLPHYRDFDVGTLRAMFRLKRPPADPTHRAADDIQRDFSQLKRIVAAIPPELYDKINI